MTESKQPVPGNNGSPNPAAPASLDPLEAMLHQKVVLDTGTPVVFLGTLVGLTQHTFVLEQADAHDCRDGHVQKDHYLAEAQNEGLTVNRRRVVVMRSAIISVSRLADVVME